jgi:hypothetical protein
VVAMAAAAWCGSTTATRASIVCVSASRRGCGGWGV